MATCLPSDKTRIKVVGNNCENVAPNLPEEIPVALLTGGQDRHYAFGLAMAIVSKRVRLDIIGSDEVDSPEFHANPKLKFLNLRGNQKANVGLAVKIQRVLFYYVRLICYAALAEPNVFHILWNNRFEYFDRTFMMAYYKLLGKKIAFTAHNVNIGRRDSADTLLSRLTLRLQYHLADHIFVHTEKMKHELLEEFGVRNRAITVIPYAINNAVPNTDLTSAEAKTRLGIRNGERTILFFGAIAPYKGLDSLVAAFQQVLSRNPNYRLIIAGKPKGGCGKYLTGIDDAIGRMVDPWRVIRKIEYVPDQETELYFKAADVLALPYTEIFQSGILFLGFSFGLPAVATDVGSFREDIIEGKTGFLCRPGNPVELAITIEKYFESDLFRNLESRRQEICDFAGARHSWDVVGEMTRNVYAGLLGKGPSTL